MNIHELDAIEKQSIEAFVASAVDVLPGRTVLDYGCGKQPYREIVENAGFEYFPYDRASNGGGTGGDIGDLGGSHFDVVICTQVIQYVPSPLRLLDKFRDLLQPFGMLVLTYPSAWPVIRDELWHFTLLGMETLTAGAGFTVARHEVRCALPFDGFEIPIGYGMVATL